MTRKLFTFLSAAALTTSLTFAQASGNANGNTGSQNPPSVANMVGHRVQMLTNLLGLSTTQQQQATTIFTDAANAQESNRASMQTAHQNLQTAVKNNDSNAIDQAATTIGTLTTQSVSTMAKAEAAFYQILTPDQQTKFSTMHGGHGFGMGGPGGMGMRGHR